MKSLLIGIAVLIIVGIGGVLYRNAIEHPNQPIACPLDAKLCPDGTSVGRTGESCTFPACPPPNVTLADANISYAIPAGFVATGLPDSASIAAYGSAATTTASSTPAQSAAIVIRQYALSASSSPGAVIQATAVGGASALPVSPTAYSSATIGGRDYTVVTIERFEGVVDTAFYPQVSAGATRVLRFDAIDTGVADWTDPGLSVSHLPAEAALRQLLAGLQM